MPSPPEPCAEPPRTVKSPPVTMTLRPSSVQTPSTAGSAANAATAVTVNVLFRQNIRIECFRSFSKVSMDYLTGLKTPNTGKGYGDV